MLLLVNHDRNELNGWRKSLKEWKVPCQSTQEGFTALQMAELKKTTAVISRVDLPLVSGFDLARMLKKEYPKLIVALVSPPGRPRPALPPGGDKNWEIGPLPLAGSEFQKLAGTLLLAEGSLLREKPGSPLYSGPEGFEGIIGLSPRMQEIFSLIRKVRDQDVTVLIQGESGTGKELVADFIHNLSSAKEGPLVKVNCGAIPETLLEAELLGYEKGAFTGADRQHRGFLEQADGGTLFLDEIGEIPHAMQVKLLRALQERKIRRIGSEATVPVSFRLVAATHRDFKLLRDEGVIRKDFFYRLNVVPLTIPPLRKRGGDIPLLVNHFIAKYASRYAKPPIRLRPEALERLQAYGYPGNVRELENLIERLQVLFPGREIACRDLPSEFLGTAGEGSEVFQCFRTELPLKEAVRDFERRFIQRVLEEEGDNRTAAARRLKISRKNLWEKLADK